MWVSPFRNLRVIGYLLLAAAFRSLSRLSSALSAKASTLRSSPLNLFPSLLRAGWLFPYIALYVRYDKNVCVYNHYNYTIYCTNHTLSLTACFYNQN